MPLNEMTVGKVEWGVEALEAWGGPGSRWVGGCRLQPDRPKQVATKQPKSWTRPDASFLQSRRDNTTKRWRHGSREGGGRREVEVEAATTAAGCGAQWGMVFGWGKGRAGQFWRCKEETREMDGVRVFGLWCSGAADGAAVASWAAEGEREKRGSSSSPVADEREPSGFWNYYERGARWDGTGGFNLKGVPGRRRGRGQQRARPLRTDLLRTALRRPRRSKAERWLCSRMTGSSQLFVGSVVGSGDGDGHDIKRHFAQACSERARGGSYRWRPDLM